MENLYIKLDNLKFEIMSFLYGSDPVFGFCSKSDFGGLERSRFIIDGFGVHLPKIVRRGVSLDINSGV